MAFPAELRVLISTVLVLILVPPASSLKNNHHYCPPSSCGNIPNISYPFRLKGDPPNCGEQRYELSCDDNTHTLLSLNGSKYYVSQINYNNYTIRIVDSGIQEDNYSFIPRYFLNRHNLGIASWTDWYPYPLSGSSDLIWRKLLEVVAIVNCEKPVSWASSLIHWDTTSTKCSNINNGSNFYFSQDSKRYLYLIVGGGANVMDVEESCTIEQISLTSWSGQISADHPNMSCTDIRNVFSYGFVLSWYRIYCGSCGSYSDCYLDDHNQPYCKKYWGNIPTWVIFYNAAYYTGTSRVLESLQIYIQYLDVSDTAVVLIGFLLGWRLLINVLGAPFVIAFLIYKWRMRHLSIYDDIEEFLQGQNNFMPIKYSFLEIKKMTKGFRERLGERGFGTVFKGTLRSGRLVAVKMLSQSKANGQDFINEVATIGRIHHVNIVQLVGFCVHGSKRALIYEFMPNGSLNKHIFSSEANIINYEKTYDIALGVAREIEYLHQGCDMQILHFDIKPHNILLDENLKPKVSDFGLAKLYPVQDSIVPLTRARGTFGYMAPEMLYKNIGGISYKADVYSFGMLLMEMVSTRKNLHASTEHLSQIYFPT